MIPTAHNLNIGGDERGEIFNLAELYKLKTPVMKDSNTTHFTKNIISETNSSGKRIGQSDPYKYKSHRNPAQSD
ncbi:hypothetical protein ACTXT7_006657 [Hymenolepis weldensis]